MICIKSSAGRSTQLMRRLTAAAMPKGMPTQRPMSVAEMISATVTIVAGQKPVPMIIVSEAAETRAAS